MTIITLPRIGAALAAAGAALLLAVGPVAALANFGVSALPAERHYSCPAKSAYKSRNWPSLNTWTSRAGDTIGALRLKASNFPAPHAAALDPAYVPPEDQVMRDGTLFVGLPLPGRGDALVDALYAAAEANNLAVYRVRYEQRSPCLSAAAYQQLLDDRTAKGRAAQALWDQWAARERGKLPPAPDA